MSKNVLITGGSGFLGAHLCEHILAKTDWNIAILDRIDMSSSLDRLTDMQCWEKEKRRVKFIWHDLKAPINQYVGQRLGELDYIMHLAAATHVDRSIDDPLSFVQDNVVGTCNLLNFARTQQNISKINIFSTDEVFGAAPEGIFYKETDMLRPENPYAASKMGQEALAHAFACTYRMPIFISRSMNIFGERQFYEKFIPNTIRKIVLGEEIIVHASPDLTKAGTRFYIHARNVAAVLLFLFEKAKVIQKNDRDSGVYNVVGEREIDNLTLIQMIYQVIKEQSNVLPPLKYKLVNFHEQRPGHDLRYSLDGSKVRDLGFRYPKSFEDSFKKSILWSIRPENLCWIGL